MQHYPPANASSLEWTLPWCIWGLVGHMARRMAQGVWLSQYTPITARRWLGQFWILTWISHWMIWLASECVEEVHSRHNFHNKNEWLRIGSRALEYKYQVVQSQVGFSLSSTHRHCNTIAECSLVHRCLSNETCNCRVKGSREWDKKTGCYSRGSQFQMESIQQKAHTYLDCKIIVRL